ncbi:MAG TPA: sigma-70 family RNA polymerase sigma factor [Acidimicrobiia bacterium]
MRQEFNRRARFEAIAAEVFEPLQRYLLRRASRDVVDDVLSEVMLVVWRRIDDAPSDGALPWSYGVARRILANRRRSEQRHLRLVDRLNAEPLPPAPTVESPDSQLPQLDLAISNLSAHDRELVRLWAWEQLEPREIAVVLDSSPNSVSLRLTRVKKKLLAELERQDRSTSGHITEKHAKEM